MFEHDYVLIPDGGALSPGTADCTGYGSFYLESRTGQKETVRLDFGRSVTNNEAEYWALLSALEDLIRTIEGAGQNPTGCDVRIVGDSQLVLNQVSGDWKCKKQHLLPLRDEAQAVVRRLRSVHFEHTPRETCVRLLGH